ncbi:hypothetical protein PN465_07960 [Nodularia spumigena CS-584]|uniref:hypothetical protein n=1 Tax=Nodularia spumigena TaxID=70799 RepID=UPI0000EAB35E|nr:hypothetical protein [Nodularia spumigena]AHJ26965.1 hypothetical protein NSP_6160 [Nodularia spumigena CCY9414]EAW45953.1 hypothetical protein N9414_16162 [Nodularia spumigena CCY9414]MDB9316255.1 hypothetical protein [Nodularia spumigena CS-590/01A]MDB9325043.1 hypothetical protein [Nodularia spumigena CS-590/02]MDB9336398.1 hypothetical protein [Nodularia spumigena CS-590/01]
MKFVYPISTSLCANICRASWELAAVGVEYLFMGDSNRDHWQITKSNHDLRYISQSLLSLQPEINRRSGGGKRYSLRNTVPK